MAAGDCKQQDVNRQGKEQHREGRKIAFALAVEDIDNHRAWAAEEVLEGEPKASILACESSDEVLEDEAHRETTGVGTLSAFGTKLTFELGAAVEAFRGLDFGLGLSLNFSLCNGLYLVFHRNRF